MIKAILIDDEKVALEVLSMQLKRFCPEVEILKVCKGGEEGIKAILATNPDLVFLDIEMPKINGFDVLEATKHLHYKIIFTTAYNQFAIKAFKYSAIDYILKPIDIEDLKAAVAKVAKQERPDISQQIKTLYEQLGITSNQPKKIALQIGEAYEMVPTSEIVRCESDSNYTHIFLADDRKVLLSKTLKEVEENLSHHSDFFRVHASHLINVQYVAKFYKTDGGYVVMKDGTSINISRSKKDEFIDKMRVV